jgi:hypothetical protein
MVTPIDSRCPQGLDRVFSGRLRNPVRLERFRINLPSQLTTIAWLVRRLDYFVANSSLIANITRCFFWLGDQFETPLLLQSVFMILAQVRNTGALSIRESQTFELFSLRCSISVSDSSHT